ncbi:hypothetical protein EV649_7987 [Kribbella sp. VKM Ac-2569]|nr:hypothetical protein EV649_7987 [Kribbella sp. VKM Ac-2569]
MVTYDQQDGVFAASKASTTPGDPQCGWLLVCWRLGIYDVDEETIISERVCCGAGDRA